MTPTVVAVLLIGVWLGAYLMFIGHELRPGKFVSRRRFAKPLYHLANRRAADVKMKELAISRWDNEGGAPRYRRERASPPIGGFSSPVISR